MLTLAIFTCRRDLHGDEAAELGQHRGRHRVDEHGVDGLRVEGPDPAAHRQLRADRGDVDLVVARRQEDVEAQDGGRVEAGAGPRAEHDAVLLLGAAAPHEDALAVLVIVLSSFKNLYVLLSFSDDQFYCIVLLLIFRRVRSPSARRSSAPSGAA